MSHLTEDDLKFLIFNKVAIRYQHDHQHQSFLSTGEICGDAYSLSDPQMWFPVDAQRTEEFERELRRTIKGMTGMGISQGGDDGWLVLLKDQYNAHDPERQRDNYKGPIFPVGRRTNFYADQIMDTLQMSPELIGRNADGGLEFSSQEIADRISDRIIDQIKHARAITPDQSAEMAVSFQKIAEKRDGWLQYIAARKERGMSTDDLGVGWR